MHDRNITKAKLRGHWIPFSLAYKIYYKDTYNLSAEPQHIEHNNFG